MSRLELLLLLLPLEDLNESEPKRSLVTGKPLAFVSPTLQLFELPPGQLLIPGLE